MTNTPKSADRLAPAELARFLELRKMVSYNEGALTKAEIAEWIALRDKRYPEDK